MWAISAHPAPKMPIRGTRGRLVVILTAAQVILRWNVQRGGVIPQSVKEERIKQNFDIWDFALSEADMQKIATPDTGKSEIIQD